MSSSTTKCALYSCFYVRCFLTLPFSFLLFISFSSLFHLSLHSNSFSFSITSLGMGVALASPLAHNSLPSLGSLVSQLSPSCSSWSACALSLPSRYLPCHFGWQVGVRSLETTTLRHSINERLAHWYQVCLPQGTDCHASLDQIHVVATHAKERSRRHVPNRWSPNYAVYQGVGLPRRYIQIYFFLCQVCSRWVSY